jgi:hypothetical protein
MREVALPRETRRFLVTVSKFRANSRIVGRGRDLAVTRGASLEIRRMNSTFNRYPLKKHNELTQQIEDIVNLVFEASPRRSGVEFDSLKKH